MTVGGLRSAFVSVPDMEKGKAFYTALLGHEPYFDEPFYVGYDVEGFELGLVVSPSGGTEAAWAVHDPDSALGAAVELGATVVEEPRDVGDGIIVATFADPFGNHVGVIRNPNFAPKLVHAGADDVSDRAIEIKVMVPVDSSSAWMLWAGSEGLAQWWTEHTRVELRPGGHYEILFNPEEAPGDRGGDWCRVLSYLPGKMLSFTWNAPPTLATRPLHTWVVLTFDPDVEGTVVTLTHLGWPESGLADPASDWQATFEYFEDAWSYVMAKFLAHFEDDDDD